jgi:hypothetical protein
MKYFKPNSKKAIKLAMFIKGLSGALSGTAFANGNEKISLGVLVIGAVCNEVINLFSDGENPESKF